MSIILEHVTHAYMADSPLSAVALSDVSLEIPEGIFLGVIGHTGSGKSTLVQHLNGLLLPTEGRVLVDGLDTLDKKQRIKARQLVGMVFQYPEYQLFEETVLKDVAFGPKNMGLSEEDANDRAEEAMALVGLNPDHFAQLSPFDLSGGEKRRAALAGILAMRPKYLVLDEPMAGLDPKGRREILELLDEIRKRSGTTIVMISHSMDDVAAASDQVLVLNHGTVAMLDVPEKVFSDVDHLTKMGLFIPQATELAGLLRQKGIDLPAGICRMDQLCSALIRRYQDGQ